LLKSAKSSQNQAVPTPAALQIGPALYTVQAAAEAHLLCFIE